MPVETAPKRLLVVQIAGLGLNLSRRPELAEAVSGLTGSPLLPPFPAVTCTAQATFRTAHDPDVHGIVANGWLDRLTHRTTFWEQSADLVSGPRIWEALRSRGGQVAMLFWQQSLGESVDRLISPAPIHKHGGGLVDTCYSRPEPLYPSLVRQLGSPFKLRQYWGPFASTRSSRWIARATAAVMAGTLAEAPDLCLSYLPALDYDLQRHGPGHPKSAQALCALAEDLLILREACDRHGYDLLAWGDYAIAPVAGGPLFPNRTLREAGLLQTRTIGARLYPDLHASRAFAVVDHQIAHIYLRDPDASSRVRDLLAPCGDIQSRESLPAVQHPRAGELILSAPPGRWLAYPWWSHPREAPDYAAHVDIHNKPGYDPCELFLGWPPGTISMNPGRIGGVHGRVGAGQEACWFSTCLRPQTHSLRSLAEETQRHLETLK
jgi:predicted AlkP superfamily pyrophosphatase or phosphodiesterase